MGALVAMSNEKLIPKTSAAGKETFEEWATRVLGPEVQGVTDWSLYRECWEAALKWKALRGQQKRRKTKNA